MDRYLVTYTEDEDEDNVKTFGIVARNKKEATNKVIDYIEENNIHPSINYGYSLVCKLSEVRADYDVTPHLSIN